MQNEKHVCTPDCNHGSSKAIWFVIIALVVIVGGYALSKGGKQSADSNSTKSVADQGAPALPKVTVPDSGGTTAQPAAPGVVASLGSYEVYEPAKLAQANVGDVVLFFRATWCPSCKGLHDDIRANLDKIPGNVTILDVDYDTYTDLKKKYGITMQHTMVQVDAEGNQIQKWSGSPTLADLVSRVN